MIRCACLNACCLEAWHGLSDPALERSLRVRLDFMLFFGFDLHSGVPPDETTHCRFRNSTDFDVRWIKKGSKGVLGYRGLARIDDEGYVEKVHITPANIRGMS